MISISSYISDISSVLFPGHCLVCDRPLRKTFLCRSCVPPYTQKSVEGHCRKCGSLFFDQSQSICDPCRLIPLPFGRIFWIWDYKDSPRDIISAAKYKPSIKLCKYLADILASNIVYSFSPWNWDTIIPIPSSKESLNFRTFNQSQILAEQIARRLSPWKRIKVELDALRYTGNETPQASLMPDQRIKNVKRRFSISNGEPANKSILLVDDVLTTGATATSASAGLLRAGAKEVDLAVLARSPSWPEHRQSISEAFDVHLLMAGRCT